MPRQLVPFVSVVMGQVVPGVGRGLALRNAQSPAPRSHRSQRAANRNPLSKAGRRVADAKAALVLLMHRYPYSLVRQTVSIDLAPTGTQLGPKGSSGLLVADAKEALVLHSTLASGCPGSRAEKRTKALVLFSSPPVQHGNSRHPRWSYPPSLCPTKWRC